MSDEPVKTDEPSANVGKKVSDAAKAKLGTIKIIIASDGTDSGKGDVFASDGKGRQCLLQRDTELEVPIGVYNILRLAVVTVHDADAAGSIIGSRNTQRFNITVVG